VVAFIAGHGGSSRRGSNRRSSRATTRVVQRIAAFPGGRLPTALQDAAAASTGGQMVLLGGLTALGRSTQAINTIHGPRVTVHSSALPRPLHDAAAVSLGGAVYLFGGGDVSSYDVIYRVDPVTGQVSPAGRLPEPRSDLAVAAIGDTAYVVGGYTGRTPLSTILAWRPGTQPRVVGRLPTPLRYAAVAAGAGGLVIAGGSTTTTASREILRFDPTTGRVGRIGVLPRPTTHAAAVSLGSEVLVLGGRGPRTGSPSAGIVAVDPRTGQVRSAGRLPEPLSDLSAATVGGSVLVAGGRTATAPTSAITQLRPETTTVSVAPAPPRGGSRRGAKGRGRGSTSATASAGSPPPLPGFLLIADRGNNRVLLVDPRRQVRFLFPNSTDLAQGRRLRYNDDAFVGPGGRQIVANEEDTHAIVAIDIATHQLHVLYGHPGVKGTGAGYLNTPDDAYPLPNGSMLVADAYNCRILTIDQGRVVHQLGSARRCQHDPPGSFGAVNGDTPLADGGILVSEIPGHWVDDIGPYGGLRLALKAPVTYPSDPQPLPGGNILLADYSNPGRVVVVDRTGRTLWAYEPRSGHARLDHPSLALPLPNGDVAVNDDYRDRVVIIDPRVNRIVWQYGRTDQRGTGPNRLYIPDGIDFVPATRTGQPDWGAVKHPSSPVAVAYP